jgi:hypothetical protein
MFAGEPSRLRYVGLSIGNWRRIMMDSQWVGCSKGLAPIRTRLGETYRQASRLTTGQSVKQNVGANLNALSPAAQPATESRRSLDCVSFTAGGGEDRLMQWRRAKEESLQLGLQIASSIVPVHHFSQGA